MSARIIKKPSNLIDQETRRRHELAQLKTRYKTTYQTIEQNENFTVIRLAIKPTDPDFPFELTLLQIQLSIPKAYPSASCKLHVLNPDTPRGFAINLEKGYEYQIKNSNVHLTLVRQMNWMDRNMESLLRQTPTPIVRHPSLLDVSNKLTDIRLVKPSLCNISLFHCTMIHLAVNCLNCKDILDIEIEREQGDQTLKKKAICPSCLCSISANFFSETVHQGMKSVGLVQLAGCLAYDVLNSFFTGTCRQCMTDLAYTLQLSPYDMPQTQICTSCSAKMTIGLGEYELVNIESKEDLIVDVLQDMKLKDSQL